MLTFREALSETDPFSMSSDRMSNPDLPPPPYLSLDRLISNNVAGLAALGSSTFATTVTYPFDTMKSRIQAHPELSLTQHLKRVRSEGGVRVLFQGVAIPLISTSAVRSVSMSVYTNSRNTYAEFIKRHYNIDVMKNIDTPGAYPSFASAAVVAAAGMGAGGTVSLVACPFELAKISAQTSGLMGLRPPLQHSSVTDPTGSSSLVSGYKGKSSIGIMKAIYINHGVKGLYTGYRVHLLRDTFGTGIYFTIYESTKQLLLTLRGRKLESDNALAGGLCGILGLVFIYPVDSAKTAYQHAFFSRPGGTVKPPPITFLKPEIYKGFWVASARSALTNAIFFSVYEFLAKQIGTKNNGTLEDEHP